MDIKPVTAIKSPDDLRGYNAYAFGSATYHGNMIEAMKKMLFIAERAALEGKVGISFGAYGWSGEAPIRIFDTMKNVFGMKMIGTPLRLKSSEIYRPDIIKKAEELGRELVKEI